MKATEVTAGLAECNGSLLPGLWRDSLHVTCRLTACTPGLAPGPTLGNEYGKTLPFTYLRDKRGVMIDRLAVNGCCIYGLIAHILSNNFQVNCLSYKYTVTVNFKMASKTAAAVMCLH